MGITNDVFVLRIDLIPPACLFWVECYFNLNSLESKQWNQSCTKQWQLWYAVTDALLWPHTLSIDMPHRETAEFALAESNSRGGQCSEKSLEKCAIYPRPWQDKRVLHCREEFAMEVMSSAPSKQIAQLHCQMLRWCQCQGWNAWSLNATENLSLFRGGHRALRYGNLSSRHRLCNNVSHLGGGQKRNNGLEEDATTSPSVCAHIISTLRGVKLRWCLGEGSQSLCGSQ